MEYNRNAFRHWLSNLPPDAPFCIKDYCPLVTYWIRTGPPGLDKGTLRNRTLKADFDLVRAIDERSGWDEITPRQVIELIDSLNRGNQATH